MVDIVIPIYKKNPTAEDKISLDRILEVLGGKFPITFIHPENLDKLNYLHYKNIDFLAFEDFYFENIQGYNRLMLSTKFYKSFQQKYILIYQTDCLVFKDNLMAWCEKNYDYIGAPWLRSRDKIPTTKKVWDNFLCSFKMAINFRGNKKWQKDKSLLYNEVGNGGLSLRKREKFIEILEKLPEVVEVYLKPENKGNFYAEDVFFSIEPKRNGIAFSKPNYKEACGFALENKPELGINLNGGKLPFGCHRWNKENRNFWEKYL